MQKEININEYLEAMTMALANHCYDDETERITGGVIESQAYIFFEIFGKNISKNLVDLSSGSDLEVEGKEEYFKALFCLYKNMIRCDANLFLQCLKGYLK